MVAHVYDQVAHAKCGIDIPAPRDATVSTQTYPMKLLDNFFPIQRIRIYSFAAGLQQLSVPGAARVYAGAMMASLRGVVLVDYYHIGVLGKP